MKIDVKKTLTGWTPNNEKAASYHKKFKLGFGRDAGFYRKQIRIIRQVCDQRFCISKLRSKLFKPLLPPGYKKQAVTFLGKLAGERFSNTAGRACDQGCWFCYILHKIVIIIPADIFRVTVSVCHEEDLLWIASI